MDKKTQNLAWSCLPRETRDFIKSDTATAWQLAYARIFGHHNLTSDEEPSELLFVERKKVLDLYSAYQRAKNTEIIDKAVFDERLYMLDRLFGDKCLPDIPSAGSGAMGTTPPSCKLDVKSDKEQSVQGEPRFKVGDKVRVIDIEEYADEITEIIAVDKSDPIAPYKLDLLDNEGGGIWCDGNAIEPYTEPETKDNMEEKELNLCELLRDYKGEKIYILSHGYMTVMGGLVGTVELEGTGEHGEVLNLMLNDDGTHIKGTEVIAFPSRTLYEKYPLDAYSAWMEWKSERTPKRWRAKQNKEFYYFLDSMLIVNDIVDSYDYFCNNRYKAGNYFSTKEEAQQAVEAVRRTLEEFHAKHTEQ